MGMIRFFGTAAMCGTLWAAASAAEIKLSELTGGAKESTLELNAKNRTVNGMFTITAIPGRLAGLPMVSVPRGTGNKEGAAYSVTIDKPATVYLLVQNRGDVTIPEGWEKVPGRVEWSGFADTVYKKEFAAGKVEVPAHNGKQGGNFGIPNAIVIADGDRESESPTQLSICDVQSKQRVAGGNFVITAIPDALKGQPMFSIPRGAGNAPGAAYSVTLAKPAKVYLLAQDRGTAAIPAGWTREEGKVAWKAGNMSFTDSVYSQDAPAGKLEIPAHNGKDGNSFGVPNAIVVVYK